MFKPGKSIIILLFILSICALSDAQTTNPFAKLKYDKVVMYDYDGEKDENLVNNKGQLTRAIIKQVVPDVATINTFNSKLNLKSSFGGGVSACFVPHLGFVYYYKNKIVAHVEVCLGCNRLRSSLPLSAQDQGKFEGGEYFLNGLSDTFRLYLNGLLKRYNFSHQVKNVKY